MSQTTGNARVHPAETGAIGAAFSKAQGVAWT